MYRHIPAEAIPAHWEGLALLIAPAVRHAPGITLQSVFDGLMAGRLVLLEVRREAVDAVMIAEIGKLDGKLVCWVAYVAGKVGGGPRAWLRTMRELKAGWELLVKRAGCVEMRIRGRDWSRVFPDYSVVDPATNELRKVL